MENLGLTPFIHIEINRTYNEWDTLSSFRMYAKDPKLNKKCPEVKGQTIELKEGKYVLSYDEKYRYGAFKYPIPEGKNLSVTWSKSNTTSIEKLTSSQNKWRIESNKQAENAYTQAAQDYSNLGGLSKFFAREPLAPKLLELYAIPVGEHGTHNLEIHAGEGFSGTRMHIGVNCNSSRGCPIVGDNAILVDTEITKYEAYVGKAVKLYNFKIEDSIAKAREIGSFYLEMQKELGRAPTIRTTIQEAK